MAYLGRRGRRAQIQAHHPAGLVQGRRVACRLAGGAASAGTRRRAGRDRHGLRGGPDGAAGARAAGRLGSSRSNGGASPGSGVRGGAGSGLGCRQESVEWAAWRRLAVGQGRRGGPATGRVALALASVLLTLVARWPTTASSRRSSGTGGSARAGPPWAGGAVAGGPAAGAERAGGRWAAVGSACTAPSDPRSSSTGRAPWNEGRSDSVTSWVAVSIVTREVTTSPSTTGALRRGSTTGSPTAVGSRGKVRPGFALSVRGGHRQIGPAP